ncbi:hypothetical protein I79_008281 [Cricetulus griseus]|uniref:Uncharacterized protein n=1 Tax=Cricetulus griseus TaxID=10029 RepID=G3HCR6_CRIGR|nr:hypothetical protein I79_008281 [Cricetulus griseus]
MSSTGRCTSCVISILVYEGHTMFKSLIEKHRGASQMGMEEGVKVEVFGLNRPLLISRRGCATAHLVT